MKRLYRELFESKKSHRESHRKPGSPGSNRISTLTPGLWLGLLLAVAMLIISPWSERQPGDSSLPAHARARLQLHGGSIRTIAYSQDGGELFTTLGFESVIFVGIDVETGEPAELADIPPTPTGLAPAISPDGRVIASLDGSHSIALSELQSSLSLGRFDLGGASASALAASAAGDWLAATDDRGKLHLWDARNGTPHRSWPIQHTWVARLAFSPDDRILTTADPNGSITRWEVATGRRVAELRGHEGSTISVVHAPDGRTLASAGTDGVIRLWDASANIELFAIGHRGGPPVLELAFSPDGAILASGHVDRVVRLWDATTGRLRHALSGHDQRVRALAFSPDGRGLASGDADGTILIWDLADLDEP